MIQQMVTYDEFTEYTIFLSYTVISCIVFLVYMRHSKCVDTIINRVLVLTMGLFLMLCAFTHVYRVWYDGPSIFLSTACALVSFISAFSFALGFQKLDDYLRLRVNTLGVVREDLIRNLSDGYDLKGVFYNGEMIEGNVGNTEITAPVPVEGQLEEKGIVKIKEEYFRITNVVESCIDLPGNIRGDYESSCTSMRHYTVFGYDATAEIHMANEQERINSVRMSLCMSTAHDVRTPLSSLGIVISCLQSLCGRSEEHEKLLDEAFVNIESINLIVTQFLEVGKMNSMVEIKPVISSMDTHTMTKRIKIVGARLSGENVIFSCDVNPRVPRSVCTDGDWVWQICLNLLTNAAKYTYEGTISVTIDFDDDNNLLLTVSDTGIGILDIEKERIFEKFITFKTFGHDSSGLGLYSVKMKLAGMNGSIEVLDNVNKNGSIFRVRIPVTVDTCIVGVEGNTSNKKILIVDDTPSVRKMMARFLQSHHVSTAENGDRGLSMMIAEKYDVVLLDMHMPVMDGLECIKRFREWEKINRDERQLIFSMSANQHTVGDKFDGCFPKPVDGQRLRSTIDRLPSKGQRLQSTIDRLPSRGQRLWSTIDRVASKSFS